MKICVCHYQSTTPSHHLGSNIQNVISLLKQHHPKLCNSSSHGSGCTGHPHHHHHQSVVAVTAVRSGGQPKNAKRNVKLSPRNVQVDCPTHRNRRSEEERQDKLKRSVSVPHLNDHVRAIPKTSAKRRVNEVVLEPKTKPTKPVLKRSASKKLNKVKETSVNFYSEYSSSSDHKSEPNGFDLNELLKILQEEYTKLVL